MWPTRQPAPRGTVPGQTQSRFPALSSKEHLEKFLKIRVLGPTAGKGDSKPEEDYGGPG